MSYPYDDQQLADFCVDCETAFTEAGQAWNARAGVWPGRMQFDAVSIGYPAARAKQLRALRQALGLSLPFEPAPRTWRANMCGVRVPGLPPVSGGAADASLVLSWFYDRYVDADRAKIRAAWRAKNYTHVLLSWPDSRAFGWSAENFLTTVEELIADGFYPCPFLYSKDHDPTDVDGIWNNMLPAIQVLKGVAPAICIGWELSIALSPTTVQQLIDWVAPEFTPAGTRVYVHFQEDYFSFPQPDHDNASFWNLQTGKLTGVLHQRKLGMDNDLYRARLTDCLDRCSGQFNMPHDTGFGHPVDCVALEITAMTQFNGQTTEAEGDALGQWAIDTPPVSGPAGTVQVMGSGNGSQS